MKYRVWAELACGHSVNGDTFSRPECLTPGSEYRCPSCGVTRVERSGFDSK